MKKLISLMLSLSSCIATFISCSVDSTEDVSNPSLDILELSVGIENISRIQLNESLETVWNSGDVLSVFYKSDANGYWRYKGEDMSTNGKISCVSTPTTATTIFSDIYAIYPYKENNTINNLGEIQTVIPNTQKYEFGSFGEGGNIMVAVSSNEDNLRFSTIFGWIRIQLYGDKKVSKIIFKGNNEEILSGDVLIDPNTCGIKFINNQSTELTLDCGDGVQLSPDSKTDFYIAVPPQNFEKGFQAIVYSTNNETKHKYTSETVTICRNCITPMSQSNYDNNISDNEIWYTTNDDSLIEIPQSFNEYVISHFYNNGRGIISFRNKITEIPENAFQKYDKLTKITIPNSVITIGDNAFRDCKGLTSINIPNNVTNIGACAFYDCTSLTNIVIPDSVISIGNATFYGCTNLKEATIGNQIATIGNRTFANCTSLTDIVIPDNVVMIGDSVFQNCTNLTNITIGCGVTSIGSLPFNGCFNLTSVHIKDLPAWCNIDFKNFDSNPLYYTKELYLNNEIVTDIVIPNNVTIIKNYTFHSCSSITSVTMPNDVISVGDDAFKECENITTVYIKDLSAWCNIDFKNPYSNPLYYAKELCLNGEKITDLVIPDDITEIKAYRFYSCVGLNVDSVTIHKGVVEIGNEAFGNCKGELFVNCNIPDYAFANDKFHKVIVGKDVTTIGNSAFSNCVAITEISLPDGITDIGMCAFAECRSLTNMVIPNDITKINPCLFNGSGLINVTIGNSVEIIDEGAFSGCPLTKVVIPDSVTEIGESAFLGCWKLSEITIGKNVAKIEGKAFSGTGLTEVIIPDSVVSIGNGAFYEIVTLKKVVVGNGVTTIGASAFGSCPIDELVLGQSIVTIEDRAFCNCVGLTNVTIPESVQNIGEEVFANCENLEAFYGKFASDDNRCLIINGLLSCFAHAGLAEIDYIIPNNVNTIGNKAFYDCKKLASIIIPDSVTSVGNYAFNGCDSLASITIPNSVTTIGDYAFDGCDSITSITIPSSVTSIGKNAFDGCRGELTINCNIPSELFRDADLTKVVIGDDVTSIGKYAFYGCDSITSISIGNGVTSVGDYAFYGCGGELTINCNIPSGLFRYADLTKVIIGDGVTSIGDEAFCICNSLTSVTIGNGVTSIGDEAFRSCDSLTSVTIGNGVTSIGDGAFRYCDGLTSITIPDSVTEIGNETFSSCYSLTSVIIGGNVTIIGSSAFLYCFDLDNIYCRSTTPPKLSYETFDKTNYNRKIYVPRASVEAYKTASGWRGYADAIEPYDF